MQLTVNSDTGANYGYHRLYGNGVSAASDGSSSTTNIDPGYSALGTDLADVYAVWIIDIHDYASTTKNKTFRIFTGKNRNTTNSDNIIQLGSGLWRSTSAITSITITAATTQASSTSFALYGIKG